MGERIVLGLGNSVDYEAQWSSRIVESLIDDFGITACDLDVDLPINNARDLAVSILGFLNSGIGGERFVVSPNIIVEWAERCGKNITVGGTSVRSAIAMHKLGYTSALHLVTMNEHVRTMIPPDCTWVCSGAQEGLYPNLIVQYPKGARVQAGDISIRSNKANRIIYVHERDNVAMRISPELAELAADAEIFLISGFNAMQSSELLADRLTRLVRVVRSLPRGAVVFYEDGGFHYPELRSQVHEALVELIDVFSLNEDEMQGYLGRKVSLLNPSVVLDALHALRRMIPVPTIVVHTRNWALAFGAEPKRYAISLRAGINMAYTRMRLGDNFHHGDYRDTEGMPTRKEGAEFAAAVVDLGRGQVCCLPSVQVNENAATTVGLGDAFVGGFLPTLLK